MVDTHHKLLLFPLMITLDDVCKSENESRDLEIVVANEDEAAATVKTD
jgi:hypothetical protein